MAARVVVSEENSTCESKKIIFGDYSNGGTIVVYCEVKKSCLHDSELIWVDSIIL